MISLAELAWGEILLVCENPGLTEKLRFTVQQVSVVWDEALSDSLETPMTIFKCLFAGD